MRYKNQLNQSPTNYTPSTPTSVESHLAAIDTALGTLTGEERVAQIIAVPHDNIPSHLLKCDGSAVSRTTYATLYAAIGVIYGNGDGTTTFNLPDYTGWFLRGRADGNANDPDRASRTDRGDGGLGDNVGTVQLYTNRTHTHELNRNTNDYAGGGGARITGSGSNDLTAANGGNEMRPDNKYVWYCIVHEVST